MRGAPATVVRWMDCRLHILRNGL